MLNGFAISIAEALAQGVITTIVGGGALLIYRYVSRRPARRQYLTGLRNHLYGAVSLIDLVNQADSQDDRCEHLKGLASFFRTIGHMAIFTETLFGKKTSLYLNRLGIVCISRAEVIEKNLDYLAELGIEDTEMFTNDIQKRGQTWEITKSVMPYEFYFLQPLYLIETILSRYGLDVGYDFFKFVPEDQRKALKKIWMRDIPNLNAADAELGATTKTTLSSMQDSTP